MKKLIIIIGYLWIWSFQTAFADNYVDYAEVIVCNNNDMKNVYLRDFFEWKQQTGESPSLGDASLSYQEKAHLVLARLVDLDIERSTDRLIQNAPQLITFTYEPITREISPLSVSNLDRNCKVQVISKLNKYGRPNLIVYKPTWDLLSEDDRAGILLHHNLRYNIYDTEEQSRYLNGYQAAGKFSGIVEYHSYVSGSLNLLVPRFKWKDLVVGDNGGSKCQFHMNGMLFRCNLKEDGVYEVQGLKYTIGPGQFPSFPIQLDEEGEPKLLFLKETLSGIQWDGLNIKILPGIYAVCWFGNTDCARPIISEAKFAQPVNVSVNDRDYLVSSLEGAYADVSRGGLAATLADDVSNVEVDGCHLRVERKIGLNPTPDFFNGKRRFRGFSKLVLVDDKKVKFCFSYRNSRHEVELVKKGINPSDKIQISYWSGVLDSILYRIVSAALAAPVVLDTYQNGPTTFSDLSGFQDNGKISVAVLGENKMLKTSDGTSKLFQSGTTLVFDEQELVRN